MLSVDIYIQHAEICVFPILQELISPMEVDDSSSSQKSKKVPSKLHVVQGKENSKFSKYIIQSTELSIS